MGPNGMGKSTLLAVAVGVEAPFKGHVKINGLTRRSTVEDEQRIREKTVYLPAAPWLPSGLTGEDFLYAVGRVYDVAEERLIEHIPRLLKLFDLESHGSRSMSQYSSGQTKKIALCSALVTDAPVMILDEPFSGGLDSSALMAMKQLLADLVHKRNVTMLIAEPVPELVEAISDRIVVLFEGRIVADASPAALREMTHTTGTLEQSLEKLVRPDEVDKVREYLQGDAT